MNSRKILIIEDEAALGETLQEYLSDQGYPSILAATCCEAEKLFKEFIPSIVLMDIGLPDGSGLELAKKLKKQQKDLILFFLSALDDPEIRLKGLEIGGHDYIMKPFALRELMLRLKRILNTKDLSHCKTIGKLSFWPKKFEVQDGLGNILPLSQKECGILKYLFDKEGEAVTREDILDRIWGDNKFPSNRTIDNYIVNLRKWADSDPEQPIKIISIRGIGYKLNIQKRLYETV